MLTVQDVLALPLFAEATLTAGQGGLDRVVRHVHILDLPDPTFQWAEGGELLLTTGYSLPDAAADQHRYIDKLHALNLAGLVISVGHYMQQTPPALLAAADAVDFPVIELPSSVAFAPVMRELMGRIIDTQHIVNQRSSEIHHTLMDLVLNGTSLQAVADVIADLLGRSITIESQSFEVLATAQVGEVDVARERSVELGQTSPALAEDLIRRGIYRKLLARRAPIYVAPIEEIGMSQERIVAPIIVAKQIIGFVWIIAGEQRLNELDNLAIETASLVTALIMMRERSLREKERNLRGDLFSRLLNHPDPTDPELVELAHHSGFRLNLAYQTIVVQAHDQNGTTTDLDRLQRRIERQLEGRKLVVQREQILVVLLQSHGAAHAHGVQFARRLQETLAHPTLSVLVGVGEVANNMAGIRDSFESAIAVLDIMTARGVHDGLYTYEDMGLLVWLKHVPTDRLRHNCYYRAVARLQQHDADLYQTLAAYLQQDKNSSLTAQHLSIHRNTLAHRLQRIEQHLGYSLDNAEVCLNLYVALEAHRFYQH